MLSNAKKEISTWYKSVSFVISSSDVSEVSLNHEIGRFLLCPYRACWNESELTVGCYDPVFTLSVKPFMNCRLVQIDDNRWQQWTESRPLPRRQSVQRFPS